MTLEWIAEHGERLGIVSILLICIGGLIWVIKLLNKRAEDCNQGRLEDKEQIAVIDKKLGIVETRMETTLEKQEEFKQYLGTIQTTMLEEIRRNNAS